MKNYFNYFTEIEEHFQRRRGTLLMLSTLDWALIETWREAGVPLEAVLRGIDAAFDKYDARKSHARVRRVNGLGYCTQEVMAAVESMKEASTGSSAALQDTSAAGFEQQRIADHLNACAQPVTIGEWTEIQCRVDLGTRATTRLSRSGSAGRRSRYLRLWRERSP